MARFITSKPRESLRRSSGFDTSASGVELLDDAHNWTSILDLSVMSRASSVFDYDSQKAKLVSTHAKYIWNSYAKERKVPDLQPSELNDGTKLDCQDRFISKYLILYRL
jgi:acyl-CoA-binding protein